MFPDWVQKNLPKARAILALAASSKSQDNIRDIVGCQKTRVGEVLHWFQNISNADASKLVSDTKVQRAWLLLELEGSPPLSWEILERFGHVSLIPDLDDACRAYFGWQGELRSLYGSTGGGVPMIRGVDF